MKRIDGIKIESFDMGNGWRMEIVTYNDWNVTGIKWESWIAHKEFGVKSLMFGSAPQPTCKTKRDFIRLAKANFDDYAVDFADEYMDC